MRLALAAFVFATVLVSCGSPARTPPPKLDVIPKGEVTSRMWSLASHVTELDTLMRAQTDAEVDQREVVRLLDLIDRTAQQLGTDEARHTHPLIAGNIDTFLTAVTSARRDAERSPPNYYLAGALTSACIYCHDPAGGIR